MPSLSAVDSCGGRHNNTDCSTTAVLACRQAVSSSLVLQCRSSHPTHEQTVPIKVDVKSIAWSYGSFKDLIWILRHTGSLWRDTHTLQHTTEAPLKWSTDIKDSKKVRIGFIYWIVKLFRVRVLQGSSANQSFASNLSPSARVSSMEMLLWLIVCVVDCRLVHPLGFVQSLFYHCAFMCWNHDNNRCTGTPKKGGERKNTRYRRWILNRIIGAPSWSLA